MQKALDRFISALPLPDTMQALAATLVTVLFIFLIALAAHFFARRVVLRGVEALLLKASSRRNEILVERHVFRPLIHIVPALIINSLAGTMLPEQETLVGFLTGASMIYMIVMMLLFVDGILNVLLEVYRSFSISKDFPIKSFVQVFKLIGYFIAIIAVISIILGKSPLQLIAGLGALTAVLMLVFKDPILGFVAGLQLSSNRMVSIGDWIEMPQHGVDGDVLEVALTTVKVRNFDNTITTVPTQSLINDSFKNWAGMQRSGGRRIKRSVYIDVTSVRFCNEEMLQRFSKIQYISEYIESKQAEVADFNDSQQLDLSHQANGRRLTNLGTFRAYIEAYLRNHPQISQELTLLVRQLKPGETGLPIEIYVFSTEKRWVQYESIQADIFDHVFAVVKEFDLRLFQNPSGADFQLALPRVD